MVLVLLRRMPTLLIGSLGGFRQFASSLIRDLVVLPVMSPMLCARQCHEIFGSVVLPISVDMMNALIPFGRPAVGLLPDQAVLGDITALDGIGVTGRPNVHIPILDKAGCPGARIGVRFASSVMPADVSLGQADVPTPARRGVAGRNYVGFVAATTKAQTIPGVITRWNGALAHLPFSPRRSQIGQLELMPHDKSPWLLAGNRLLTATFTKCHGPILHRNRLEHNYARW